MESIELTPTDRQLLLYDIFKGSRQVELADITSRLPIGRKMIQRDMKTLRDAGLLEASYSAKEKAYIVKRVEPRALPESAAGHKGRKYLHLSKFLHLLLSNPSVIHLSSFTILHAFIL